MIHCIYHWHSFVQIQTNEGNILIDPYITDNPKCDISLTDLADVAHIIITHGHADHVWDTVYIANHFPQSQITTIYGLATYLQHQWIVNQIHGLGIWGTVKLNDALSVKCVSAVHDGAILDTWLYAQASGMLIYSKDKIIYHAWDTALHTDMKLLGDWPRIDCAFLPIWDIYTMWVSDSIIATDWIKPKIVVPIHYNTRPKIKVDELDRATNIMQQTKSIPKVLHAGQYVVLDE